MFSRRCVLVILAVTPCNSACGYHHFCIFCLNFMSHFWRLTEFCSNPVTLQNFVLPTFRIMVLPLFCSIWCKNTDVSKERGTFFLLYLGVTKDCNILALFVFYCKCGAAKVLYEPTVSSFHHKI
jgi:hypothetical protein